MKLSTVVAAGSLLAGTALAAKASDNIESVIKSLPQCVQDCIPDAITETGCKKSDDYDCACDNFAEFTLDLSTCLAGKVITGDCSMADVSDISSLSTDACTDWSDKDLQDLSSALSDVGAPLTDAISGVTSLVGDVTSKAGDVTSKVGDITSRVGDFTATATDGPAATADSGSSDGDGDDDDSAAGPMVTPMAWAGAAVVLAAMAL
jgi:hypothetical protein